MKSFFLLAGLLASPAFCLGDDPTATTVAQAQSEITEMIFRLTDRTTPSADRLQACLDLEFPYSRALSLFRYNLNRFGDVSWARLDDLSFEMRQRLLESKSSAPAQAGNGLISEYFSSRSEKGREEGFQAKWSSVTQLENQRQFISSHLPTEVVRQLIDELTTPGSEEFYSCIMEIYMSQPFQMRRATRSQLFQLFAERRLPQPVYAHIFYLAETDYKNPQAMEALNKFVGPNGPTDAYSSMAVELINQLRTMNEIDAREDLEERQRLERVIFNLSLAYYSPAAGQRDASLLTKISELKATLAKLKGPQKNR